MIFIGGISNAVKQLSFLQTIICKSCGRYSSIQVFMTYTYFSFFFIPLFKWGKKYYARTNCCQSVFSIDSALGKAIERGETVTITEEDLHNTGYKTSSQESCPHCGYPISSSDFTYCPKCGNKLS